MDAAEDGSSVLCRACGALVNASRMMAHQQVLVVGAGVVDMNPTVRSHEMCDASTCCFNMLFHPVVSPCCLALALTPLTKLFKLWCNALASEDAEMELDGSEVPPQLLSTPNVQPSRSGRHPYLLLPRPLKPFSSSLFEEVRLRPGPIQFMYEI